MTIALGESSLRIVNGKSKMKAELDKRKMSPDEYSARLWQRSNKLEKLRRFNPIWFYDLIPNAQSGNVRINALGFRGDDIALVNKMATRIVCIGSSSTYGWGLDQSSTYPKKLQDFLNGPNPGRYEVVNAGFPGFLLWQQTARFSAKIVPLQPDIIFLNEAYCDLAAITPADILNTKPGEKKHASYLIFYLLNKSYLYNLFLKISGVYQYNGVKNVPLSFTKRYVPYRFIQDYLDLVHLIKSHHIRLILCTYPSPLGEKMVMSNGQGANSLEYLFFVFNTVVKNIAREDKVELVDLASVPALNRRDMYIDDCHPTTEGAELIARTLHHYLTSHPEKINDARRPPVISGIAGIVSSS